MRALIVGGLMLALSGAAWAASPPEKLVLLQTESRIEVDSSGKVVSIKTTPALPAAVDAAVTDNLRQLRFAPPMKDGKPVSGVTYVQQDACAAPVEGGGYRFAVKFRGNGPGLEQSLAPAYPHAAMRAGVAADWKIVYAVDAEGKARVVEAVRSKGGGGRFDRDFRAALEGWVGALRFRPELVDGQPVGTQVSDRVEFVLTSAPRAAAERDRLQGNEACQLALAERDPEPRRVALDSPFKLLPAN